MIQDAFVLASADHFWTDPKTWTAITAIVLSVGTLFVTYRWTIRHKEFDITMHFQEAWDDLEMLKSEVDSKPEAQYWFNRYWNLQIRQFEYWLRGYIRDEIFIYWMRCRRADYEAKRRFIVIKKNSGAHDLEYTYDQGWEDVKNDVVFTEHPYRFREFMDHILSCDKGDMFAKYILESKEDLFGLFDRFDRRTFSGIESDPTKPFRLRRRS